MTRRRPRPSRSTTLCGALVATALLAAAPALAVTHLKAGMTPPPIELVTLEGTPLALADARGRPAVVLFGELYHEKTLDACGSLRAALEDEALARLSVAVMLVVAQDAPREQLQAAATDPRLPAAILQDARRRVYADYRVTVMPSAVVVDADGKVVHALAGYTARFGDIVGDALRVAAGVMDRASFERALHPAAVENVDEARVRAGRLARLAAQLAERGLPELAEEKYAEALELAPDLPDARLGLGKLRLGRRQLAEAEREFRAVLAADPGSIDAALALAFVQSLRGGDELEDARRSMVDLLAAQPDEPRAHYVLGLVLERSGESAEAIVAYRRATELLMRRRDAWAFTPGAPASPGGAPVIGDPGGAP